MSHEEYGGETAARALSDAGVTEMFGVIGSTDLICEPARGMGIRHIVTRHEQAGGFAADGYARSSRRPGVAYTSNGPGLANVMPGIYHAEGANSPVVLLAGSQPPIEDGMRAGQASRPAEVLRDLCKWTQRIIEPSTMNFWIRKALRDAVQPLPGPVALEFSAKVLATRGTEAQLKYPPEDRIVDAPCSGGDPMAVREVARAIASAERPVIIAGDGVYWSDGARELTDFARRHLVPTCTRRTARGAFPEDEPFAFTPGFRRGFLEDADLICLIGHPVTGMDEWYEPPDWNHDATWIQIQDVPGELWYGIPTDHAVIGASRLVLQQLSEAMREFDEIAVDRKPWVEALARARERVAQRRAEVTDELRGNDLIHPQVLCAEIAEFLDPTATLIYDSFTASNFMTGQVTARYAGHVLDAGLFQTLGHGIGMAIGAQVARPGKQVLSLIGDGGFGIAGMDMETMVRYGLPAVVVLYNNSSWGGRAWGHDEYYPERGSGALTPDLRYDEMFRAVGCHTEHVTKAADIRPALERTFASGQPGLINVVGETTATVPFRARVNLLDVWTRQNVDDLPEVALREMRSWPPSMFERASKRSRDNLFGQQIPAEELAEMVGVTLPSRED